MSSILDTSELHEWLKNGFSKKEWKSISDPSCEYLSNKNGSKIIPDNIRTLIKDHSESLKGKNHYGFKDKAMSEGSWVLDGILMPLKFADRILKDIRLSFA
ncbi:hypothetical protein C2G38_592588 [Gigaspora rosea]|uniref:Uncharacterized protein n=1 Tax=Gigaspora rosea TaxID=44941 RepID=A0A397U5I0_9GLOM|nr:hypothetical protein C2G38_592588 [Gigaspora rosea]